MKHFDVVVVGAGPGGLAAAATAVDAGKRICVIDDNLACGGQIWRGKVKGPAAEWVSRIEGRVEMRLGWRVVDAPAGPASVLRIERDGEAADLGYQALVLATGARERFLPFPGWTLPGVFGAGGLQAFVKSGFDIAGRRIVVAGTGPLLLAVAAGLHREGARIVMVAEQAPLAKLAQFGLGLITSHPGKLLEGAGYRWEMSGTRYRTDAWVTRAEGQEKLERITVRSGGKSFEVDADLLAIGFHLVPNVEVPQMLGCKLDQGYVRVNAFQQTSVENIYCVGEVTGIGGVEKAQVEGRIAGLAISGNLRAAQALAAQREKQMRFARRLDQAFALRDELRRLVGEDTIVCRCEDVRHGELHGCRSWREAKLHTRCGMGPCQGRVCGPATQFFYGWSLPEPRPPVFPASLETLSRPVVDDPGNESDSVTALR